MFANNFRRIALARGLLPPAPPPPAPPEPPPAPQAANPALRAPEPCEERNQAA